MIPLKNRPLRTGAFILVGLALAFLAGPRVPLDETIRPVELPADLEHYLRESEAAVAGLRPGTEKVIIWADPATKSQTEVAIVYLPGFTATRQETAPLADQLAAALGANLFYTRLTGHGQDGTALAEATVNDWLNDAVEALAIGRRLGKRVILMGASTGGLLATWLAGQPQTDDMTAVLLLSPNFGLNERSSEIMLWPWARYLVPLLAGPIQSRSPFNEEDGLYWTTTYPTTALMPVMGLVKLSRSFDYAKLQTPIFVAYSPHDTRVDPKLIEQRFQQFGSPVKQLQAVETAEDPFQHVIAGRIRSPGTTDWLTQQLLDFVQPLLTTN